MLAHLFSCISVGISAFGAGLEDTLKVGVAVIFEVIAVLDVAGEWLVVFIVLPVLSTTKPIANTIITIKMIKNCFFIIIPFLEIFP